MYIVAHGLMYTGFLQLPCRFLFLLVCDTNQQRRGWSSTRPGQRRCWSGTCSSRCASRWRYLSSGCWKTADSRLSVCCCPCGRRPRWNRPTTTTTTMRTTTTATPTDRHRAWPESVSRPSTTWCWKAGHPGSWYTLAVSSSPPSHRSRNKTARSAVEL